VATLALVSALPASRAAETNTPSAPVTRVEETNSQSQKTLREYLHLQEQIHAAQLAIEQNRQETKEAADQAAKALAGQLQTLEQTLGAQRARELEAAQSSNRVILIVVGTFATVGFAAILLMAWFQWRGVNRLAEISATLPAVRSLGSRPAVAALGPAEQSSLRLLGALERLEKRIYELGHNGQLHLTEGTAPSLGLPPGLASSNGNGVPTELSPPADTGPIPELLAKGQSMLKADNAEAALVCFNEALTLDPGNSEALVKKGSVLEQLQRLDEAIGCYDQAIATNPSMTTAYLHKGGLFNRMERFNEALECYEQALRTQQKRNGTAEP
jgi:tetratricopeptide (TPR) repeat protein